MPEEIVRIQASDLVQACERLLQKVGVPPDEARIIAEIVVEADLRGVESHGLLRLPAYVHRVQAGLMTPKTEVKVVRERSASVLLDAQRGFGQVAGVRAMAQAMERARQHGVGVAAVRNANHFGIAAYYAMMALPHRMIGVVTANAAPSMAAWGGAAPVLGTNPVCIAIPTGGDVDIVLDMASSVVARGKIRLAANKGERIPLGWALDAQGRPTDDPKAALDGTLVPIGGPKGYGLALAIDVLSGVLTGADFGTRLTSVHDLQQPSSVGFVTQALDISAFADWDDFCRDMQSLVQEILHSPRAPGVERIYLPGEIEWLKRQDRLQNGVPVPASVLVGIRGLAQELGVEVAL
ncbi:MAG: Ldh family oxidoreductase [Chloroflexi bacterium]|nr:Ldh family oxidoreductase [Chloroflexota bacterium]